MSGVIEQSVVNRMVVVVQQIASIRPDAVPAWLVATWDEAGEIAALLPPPDDPDLVTAREVCEATLPSSGAFLSGAYDNGDIMRCTVAALRKAREEGAK